MEIIERYINPQNIDLLFKLYGFEVPLNVHYHYEIKKQYFLDYIKNSKIFEANKRTKPNGNNNKYFTITELRSYLPEGKNVNFWTNYDHLLKSLDVQKYFGNLKDISVFKGKFSDIDKYQVEEFYDFLINNPRWNYREHLIYFVDKIRQKRRNISEKYILKLYESCILGGNYKGFIILMDNYDLFQNYQEEILNFACASWDINIFKILYQKYKINYLKKLSFINIDEFTEYYSRYNQKFLLTFLKYNAQDGRLKDYVDDILESLLGENEMSEFKLMTVDILRTLAKGYSTYYKSYIFREDLERLISENPNFDFLLPILDSFTRPKIRQIAAKVSQERQNSPIRKENLDKNSSFNRKNVSYSAVLLDENSKDKILSYFNSMIPNDWKKFGHHMTIKMGPLENKQDLGKQVVLEVVGIGKSEMAIAAQVKGYPSMNKIPHITLAININQGGKPVMSNFIKDWEPISLPFKLTGIVTEV